MRLYSGGLRAAPIKRLFGTNAQIPAQKSRAEVYTELAEIPIPVSARFRNAGKKSNATEVEVTCVVRDHLQNLKRTKLKTIRFLGGQNLDHESSALTDLEDVVLQATSPSQQIRAVFKVVKKDAKETRRLIELWKDGLLIRSLDVTGTHGDFYTDDHLSSFSISPFENALVYTAEQNPPSPDNPFEFYKFNPDFGEGLAGKKSPSLFILRWNAKDMTPSNILGPVRLDTPSNIRFGQATFSPLCEDTLYATGYELTTDGRALGLRGCFNRPSGIWKLDLASEPLEDPNTTPISVSASKITPSHLSCRSPRTFFQGSDAKLLWLSAATGGPHLSTDSIQTTNITTSAPVRIETLSDVVDEPQSGEFPGLYAPCNLPTQPVLRNGTSDPLIVTYSQWGSRMTVVGISSATGTVRDLTPDDCGQHFSWNVLATDGESRVLATRSNLGVPYELMLGTMDEHGEMLWKVLDRPILSVKVQEALATVQTKIIPIPGRVPVETIVTQSTLFTDGKTTPPCITWPHGGPHASASTEFYPLITALVLEGYTVSQPNYTGSLGYGDKFVRALLGKCGTLDVEDCIASAEHLISLGISEKGPGKQLVTGGSHGGFLTGHLIGQYPTFFSAAVLRNAVTSATNTTTTDIPDWYFSEFGLQYELSSSVPTSRSSARGDERPHEAPLSMPIITTSMYDALYHASPISKVDNVCIPVLILTGAEDRRVAPSHSVEYYHALKAKAAAYLQSKGSSPHNGGDKGGLSVELLVFKGEGHSLDGVETSRVNFEVIKQWFGRVRK
ncbi:hypothetical protein CVT24_001680 [Panaeolus cyanescens]|uniref:acylaminoacyl-peptidase n=1 Tax=Panaeolus cyanescens TaxID=181874 RepID=A0A409YFM4_9AGAR|nr:hypothetical protein CVT24_001680 [Panaeolus cyanescens]